MVTLLAYFAGVSASLLVTQTSYFAPTLLLGSVLSGLGAAAIARQLVLLRRGAVPLRARFITSARPEPVEGSS